MHALVGIGGLWVASKDKSEIVTLSIIYSPCRIANSKSCRPLIGIMILSKVLSSGGWRDKTMPVT